MLLIATEKNTLREKLHGILFLILYVWKNRSRSLMQLNPKKKRARARHTNVILSNELIKGIRIFSIIVTC